MSDLRAMLGDRYQATIQAALLADKPGLIEDAKRIGGELGQLMYLANVDRVHRTLTAVLPDLLARAWGNPVGQSHDGVVAWLRNPISQVSAHYVISPGRVTQILPLTSPSWANGNAAVNARSLTFELDPNDVAGTIITFVELLVHLVRSGDLHPDYVLSGHRDHYPTACPGTYYPRLGAIRTAATTTRLPATSGTIDQEDDMPITDADIERIARRTAQIIIEDHPIVRPDGHPATLGQHVADIAQTCVALRDGDLPVIERPDGEHRADLGMVLGNIEARVITIYDRTKGLAK